MKNNCKAYLDMLGTYNPNVPFFFNTLLHGITSYVKGFYKLMTILNNLS